MKLDYATPNNSIAVITEVLVRLAPSAEEAARIQTTIAQVTSEFNAATLKTTRANEAAYGRQLSLVMFGAPAALFAAYFAAAGISKLYNYIKRKSSSKK